MNAERDRLAEADGRGIAWKKWGPYLSERQWGTVREDYSEDGNAWDSFPRSGAVARLPLGRGRAGGHLRRQAAALLRARALEREGPDPQGAPLRADERRRQPRRGRQGVLLLPRLHADAFVHEVPLQVPAGGLSLRRSRRTKQAPQPRNELEYELLDTGVFDEDRYFDVFVEYAKESPEDILIRITVHNRGPEAGRAARPADALVPQHLVVGPGRPRPCCRRCGPRGPAPSSRPLTPGSGTATSTCDGDGRAPVHGERDERRADLRRDRTRRRTSRTASTDSSCTARAAP